MKSITAACLSLGILCCSIRTLAQEKAEPPEQIRRLNSLVGTFEGDASMTEEGKTMKGHVRHVNSSISDGWGFLMEEEVTMEGLPPYKAHNIVGFDPGGGQVHVFTVSNASETHDHKGKWKNASTIIVKYEGKRDGKAYVETATLMLDGSDSYTLSWTSTLGGKPGPSGEEKVHRVAQ